MSEKPVGKRDPCEECVSTYMAKKTGFERLCHCSLLDEWLAHQEGYAAGREELAREILAFRNDYAALRDSMTQFEFKEKYGLKEVHDFQKSLFAWLRVKGVL